MSSVRRLSLALAAAALALYLATLSNRHSADALLYAAAIDSPSWRDRLDAYHLLIHPLSWLWVELCRAAGWRGPTIVPLQVLNALGGAASVGLVCSIVARAADGVVCRTPSEPRPSGSGRPLSSAQPTVGSRAPLGSAAGARGQPALGARRLRWDGSLGAAALAASGCAVSGGLWLLATEAEGVALALPLHLALLAHLLRLEPGEPVRPRRALLLGGTLGLAALTYLTFAFLLPLALLVLWQGGGGRARAAGALLAGFALVTVPAALFTVQVQVGLSHWPRMLSLYGGRGVYGVPGWQSLPRGAYAFLRMLVLYPGLGINDSTAAFLARAGAGERAALVLTYAAVAGAALLPLVLAWRHRHRCPAAVRARLALWAAPYAAFAVYWVPSDLEFWIPVSIGWFVAVGLLLAAGILRPSVAAAGVLVLLVANGCNLILPHHRVEGRHLCSERTMHRILEENREVR